MSNTNRLKLIYAFTIPDEKHSGYIKIGQTKLTDPNHALSEPNSDELNVVATKRIEQYTKTAGIDWVLLYTEPASCWHHQLATFFSLTDKDIHRYLLEHGTKRASWGHEWFKCNVDDLKNAIQSEKQRLLEAKTIKRKKTQPQQTIKTIPQIKLIQDQDNTIPQKEYNQYQLKTEKDIIDEYEQITKKYIKPNDYGEFSGLLDFYDAALNVKESANIPCDVSINCDVLRLNDNILSKNTITALPTHLHIRITNLRNYTMTGDDLEKSTSRGYFKGENIYKYVDGTFRVSCYNTLRNKDGYLEPVYKDFKTGEAAIEYRNEHNCGAIRCIALEYKKYIDKQTFDLLSNLTPKDIEKLQSLPYYEYNTRIHLNLKKLLTSGKIYDKNKIEEIVGRSIV